MNPTLARVLRTTAEFLAIALLVSALVTAWVYSSESPFFDHPWRGDTAWHNFINASRALSILGTVAAWVLWFVWRRRAALDAQPDAPARLLAAAVVLLPKDRADWGAAMTAELAGVTGSRARWSFAAGCARTALFPPRTAFRPATGWAGGGVGLLGAAACAATATYMLVTYPTSAGALNPVSAVMLVLVPAGGAALALAGPAALTSSAAARRVGLALGVATGAGLFLTSRAGAAESGALEFLVPVQFLAFVVAPATIALVTRSLRAGLQTILWAYVFGAVATFPVYLVESIRVFGETSGLYLDGDLPTGATVGNNLNDAVGWLFLVVPSVLVPLGVLGTTLAAAIARACHRSRPSAASGIPAGA
jgi:hypothetical protein